MSIAAFARGLVMPVSLVILICPAIVMAVESNILYEQHLAPYPIQITLPAAIDGKSYTFILDTGTYLNTFDPSLKGHLGKFTGMIQLDTGRGLAESETFESPPMKVGRFSPMPLEGVIFDFHPFQSTLGFDFRGMIGSGALRQNALWLDYDHQSLKILNTVYPETKGMSKLSIVYPDVDLLPFVKAGLLGRVTNFLIDTGKNRFIGLAHDMFTEFLADGTIVEDPGQLVNEGTAVGMRSVRRAHFSRGELLGVDLQGIPVNDSGNSCQVGLGFLCNLNCILDLKDSLFYYQVRRAAPPIVVGKMLGAVINYPEGVNTVVQIDPKGGAVPDAGIKVGDHFVRLGPIDSSGLNEASIYELCLNHAGESITAELQRPGMQELIKAEIQIPQRVYEYPVKRR